MLELAVFLIGYWMIVMSFVSWKNDQKRNRGVFSSADSEESTDSTGDNTRLSRRYQDSSVFESVLGCSSSHSEDVLCFRAFVDKFQSFADVSKAMRVAGFGGCQLIVGVDFTASNEWQGRKTFSKNCLHTILLRGSLNPYQRVITTLGTVLEPFTDSKMVYAFGFGDRTTRDFSVFPFRPDMQPCYGFQEVLSRYTELARSIVPAGPTSFAPVLEKAMEIVRDSGGKYHILVLISDGQMGEDEKTVEALVSASSYPLSIVMVGVGDGPWERMEEYDDLLPMRKFDNFQFVDYFKATNGGKRKNAQAALALHALMEVPDQYKAIRHLGYI